MIQNIIHKYIKHYNRKRNIAVKQFILIVPTNRGPTTFHLAIKHVVNLLSIVIHP